MFTKETGLYNTLTSKNLTRENLKRIVTVSFSLGKGKTTKPKKTVTKNTCCYCSADRGLIRVRHFFVCTKHAKAWGIA